MSNPISHLTPLRERSAADVNAHPSQSFVRKRDAHVAGSTPNTLRTLLPKPYVAGLTPHTRRTLLPKPYVDGPPPQPLRRVCTKCRRSKPLDQFQNRRQPGALTVHCLGCRQSRGPPAIPQSANVQTSDLPGPHTDNPAIPAHVGRLPDASPRTSSSKLFVTGFPVIGAAFRPATPRASSSPPTASPTRTPEPWTDLQCALERGFQSTLQETSMETCIRCDERWFNLKCAKRGPLRGICLQCRTKDKQEDRKQNQSDWTDFYSQRNN
ncbi:hypothetical protein N7461_004777 [Penicillium sp. DV-2018c]|nr:hypothetical protein N7461_004777 [Penicillium sp. DV-2018c]